MQTHYSSPMNAFKTQMFGPSNSYRANLIIATLKITLTMMQTNGIEKKERNGILENQFNVRIKYHTDAPHVKENEQGDMYDICAAETVELKKGESRLIDLGISIKMPEGCTCWIVPRSSTYKRYKIIQTNSVGVIDGSYSGNNDIIKFPARADEDTVIHKGDYICQMCVTKRPPRLTFTEVDSLDDMNRGGFGSTGR